MIEIFDKQKLEDIQNNINYKFSSLDYLCSSLIHSSYSNENRDYISENNERMEFFGDAVLSLIITEYLYKNYTSKSEKEMSSIRAHIVSSESLAEISDKIELHKYIITGKGIEQITDSVKADSLEALVCAVYLDSDFNTAYSVIIDLFEPFIHDSVCSGSFYDSKMMLQEYCMSEFSELPEYVSVKTEGPEHSRTFTVEVWFKNKLQGTGKGPTLKKAQKKAAAEALKKVLKKFEECN